MGVWFGCTLPSNFGDWQAEYRSLKESVGLLDQNYRAYLKFAGPDRVRYLNAILTNDIKGLRENHANVSLFLNPQGHIQAEIETYALAEKLFCVSYAMIRERLVPAMDRYIIMDDVTLEDQSEERGTVGLEGPKAEAVIGELANVKLSELEELESREASVNGIACRIVKRKPGEKPGAELLLHREQVPELWRVLNDMVMRQGGRPAGYTALNALRLEQGVPWFGYDFGEKQIPHEAGLQDSHISYAKGCYTGQEIVERVRSRGQVNRVRVNLQFEGEAAPEANAALLSEGKEAGYVTRTGFSPAVQAWIGMGYVRREHGAVGTELKAGENRALVVARPVSLGD